MRAPRFEVVRTRPKGDIVRHKTRWHARYVAANGQPVWTTETYTRRRAALAAIRGLPGFNSFYWTPTRDDQLRALFSDGTSVEVRDVDA